MKNDLQRNEQWYANRKGKITASNVGAILGLDPYRNRGDIMRMMVREHFGAEKEFKGNPATDWGNYNEPNARGQLLDSFLHGKTIVEAGFFTHPIHDWLGASPDGLIHEVNGKKLEPKAVLEIKCPWGLRNAEIPTFKDLKNGLPHYYAQVQIQMACTGLNVAYFYQWCPKGDDLEILSIDKQWLDENIPRLKAFYDVYLEELKHPEIYLEEKRKTIDTKLAETKIALYDSISDEIKKLTELKAQVLAEIVELAGEQDADICGRKLTHVHKQGPISYAKAIKELAPDADLDKWRGNPTDYWMLS